MASFFHFLVLKFKKGLVFKLNKMALTKILIFVCLFGLGLFEMVVEGSHFDNKIGAYDLLNLGRPLMSFKAKARPAPGTSPLDPNESIAHELDSLNQILGIVGAGSGGLVQALTGVSIHDCAGQIKGKDLDNITCEEFINELAECESLQNVKDLVIAAGKKKYKKKYNSKEPCFGDKKRKAKKM